MKVIHCVISDNSLPHPKSQPKLTILLINNKEWCIQNPNPKTGNAAPLHIHSMPRVYTASKLAEFGSDSPDKFGGYIYAHLNFLDITYYRETATVTTPFFFRASTNSEYESGTRQKNRWHFLDLGAF
jgi:hypothetical protein